MWRGLLLVMAGNAVRASADMFQGVAFGAGLVPDSIAFCGGALIFMGGWAMQFSLMDKVFFSGRAI